MKSLAQATLLLLASACVSTSGPDYGRALENGANALIPVEAPSETLDLGASFEARAEILPALERSLAWAQRPHAKARYPMAGISHEQLVRTLERLKMLLETSEDRDTFALALRDEFDWYISAGWDSEGGGVLFTGYCTPILHGSEEPTGEFRYPLYALPQDLVKSEDGTTAGRRDGDRVLPEYPERAAIDAGFLKDRGLELVWLADPIDSLLAHVNGSAVIRLRSGKELRLGYAGKNGQPYSSVGKALVERGEVKASEISLLAIRQWAASHPEEVDELIRTNRSYVFFQPITGNPHGSLDFPVTQERSLATDKTLFPPGAPVYVHAELPSAHGQAVPFHQLMFDQDTGGAIRTAGRSDIYLGVGPSAEARAGQVQHAGQLYYFFAR